MEIIAVLGILLVVFLIENQLYLLFMQHMHKKAKAKVSKIISGNTTNSDIQTAAKEIYGFHKMGNLLANMSARFLAISAWVANIGMVVCLGASILLFFNSDERYHDIAFLTIGIYLLWIAVKWLMLMLANLIADTTPGAPEAALKWVNQTDFEGDLSLLASRMLSENPRLEELNRALEGEKSELEELTRALRRQR